MLDNASIAIIGLGTMGSALAQGLIRSGKVAATRIVGTVRSRAAAERAAGALGVRVLTDNAEACRAADIVVLCVKPRDVEKVAGGLAARDALAHRPLVISIAAGTSTGFLERCLGGEAAVVRAMPNTPCFIGKGMTVVAKGSRATDDHIAIAREVFSSVGRVLELEEKHMDTVTGLSASGPAFFIYLIVEALADGGVMRGLPRGVATELVAQMTLGAAEMVLATGRHPAALKDDVTTPAGCTIAGILVLEDGRIRSVLARGVETASKVAGELGR